MEFLQGEIISGVPNMVFLWGGIVILIVIFSIVASALRKKSMAKQAGDFLSQHPDAARVYLNTKGVVTSESIVVHAVNNGAPNMFLDKEGQGFFLTPGVQNVRLSYSYTRPGVMHRSVTKYTDEIDERMEVYAGRKYSLAFSREDKVFTLADITDKKAK